MSPSRRRRAVDHVVDRLHVSERRACKVLHQPRSTQRHLVIVRDDEDALTRDIVELASSHRRRQPAARRANVAVRGRLHVYAYEIRDDAAVGGDSVDVDARLPRRRYLAGDGRTRCLRDQPRLAKVLVLAVRPTS